MDLTIATIDDLKKEALDIELEVSKKRTQELIDRPTWGVPIDPNDLSKGKNYPLHDHQRILYESQRRYTAGIAGTGGGKTAVGALWSVKQINQVLSRTQKIIGKPYVLGFIVAPTYKILSRATVPMFMDVISGTAIGPSAGGRYLESKSYYELPNKWGKIWCQGADNPYGLEGGQFDFVWGDEGGQISKRAFNALIGRTGQKQAPILITTTPYITSEGFGPLHKQWMPRFKAGDKDYLIVNFPSIANPAYPIDEYERQKRSLPPEIFASRYQGLFTAIEGQVYPGFPKVVQNLSKEALEDLLKQCYRFVGGIDYGWNDPFCAVAGGLLSNPFIHNGEPLLLIFFERYKSLTTLDEHATHIPKEIYGKPILWYSEHNPEAIHKLKKGGHIVKKAPKLARGNASSAIMNGILAVNRRIYNNTMLVVSNRCPAVVAESETYIYPEKDEEVIGDKPVDKDNHAMDAMRYMISGLDIKKAV